MIQIIPAILATSEEQYQSDISKLATAITLRDSWIHIDFADNIFVQNKTIGADVVSKFPANFLKEAHLMVARAKEWVDKLTNAGFERIIFHIESEDDTLEVIDHIKGKGIEVGLAIKMNTPINKLQPFVSKIDIVLVMSIIPGFQGQPFIEESLDRIREIKSKNWPIRVGIDGAVKDINAREIVETGVDFIVVGSFLLKGNIEENLEKLWVELSK